MKRRIALSGKAQKISTIAIVTAIAGVVGLGGLAITSGAVNETPTGMAVLTFTMSRR